LEGAHKRSSIVNEIVAWVACWKPRFLSWFVGCFASHGTFEKMPHLGLRTLKDSHGCLSTKWGKKKKLFSASSQNNYGVNKKI